MCILFIDREIPTHSTHTLILIIYILYYIYNNLIHKYKDICIHACIQPVRKPGINRQADRQTYIHTVHTYITCINTYAFSAHSIYIYLELLRYNYAYFAYGAYNACFANIAHSTDIVIRILLSYGRMSRDSLFSVSSSCHHHVILMSFAGGSTRGVWREKREMR